MKKVYFSTKRNCFLGDEKADLGNTIIQSADDLTKFVNDNFQPDTTVFDAEVEDVIFYEMVHEDGTVTKGGYQYYEGEGWEA